MYIITILYGTETPVEIGDHIHPGTHCKTSECKLGFVYTADSHWYMSRTQMILRLLSWQASPTRVSIHDSLCEDGFVSLGRGRKGVRGGLKCSPRPQGSRRHDCELLNRFLSKCSLSLKHQKSEMKYQMAAATYKKRIPTLQTM